MQAWERALDLRTELQEWWLSDGGKAFSRGWSKMRATNTNLIYSIGSIEVAKLGIAAPYYVTGEMVDMLDYAAASMPNTPFHPSDLPSDAGFVLLSKPLAFIDIHGKEYPWSAFAWCLTGTSADPTDAHGIHLTVYAHAEHDPEHQRLNNEVKAHERGYKFCTLSLLHETPWRFGEGFLDKTTGWQGGTIHNQDIEITPEQIEGSVAALRQIHAFFLLAQQRIAHPYVEQPSRPVRKRAQNFDPNRLIPDVRVITLRRYRISGDNDEPLGESPQWTHRWLVRGFWRKQWYPSEGRHKPKWIAPYVKGPEDKPLVVKDTAFLFRR